MLFPFQCILGRRVYSSECDRRPIKAGHVIGEPGDLLLKEACLLVTGGFQGQPARRYLIYSMLNEQGSDEKSTDFFVTRFQKCPCSS